MGNCSVVTQSVGAAEFLFAFGMLAREFVIVMCFVRSFKVSPAVTCALELPEALLALELDLFVNLVFVLVETTGVGVRLFAKIATGSFLFMDALEMCIAALWACEFLVAFRVFAGIQLSFVHAALVPLEITACGIRRVATLHVAIKYFPHHGLSDSAQ